MENYIIFPYRISTTAEIFASDIENALLDQGIILSDSIRDELENLREQLSAYTGNFRDPVEIRDLMFELIDYLYNQRENNYFHLNSFYLIERIRQELDIRNTISVHNETNNVTDNEDNDEDSDGYIVRSYDDTFHFLLSSIDYNTTNYIASPKREFLNIDKLSVNDFSLIEQYEFNFSSNILQSTWGIYITIESDDFVFMS